VLIADVSSMGAQLFVAYVNSKKQSEVQTPGSWDQDSVQGHFTDAVYAAIERVEKQTIMHQLLLLAMKLVKMMLDKKSKPHTKAEVSKQLRTTFASFRF
jgi:hypothetical protein